MNSSETQDFAAWLEAARAGEGQARDDFVNRYGRLVRSIIAKRIRDSDDTDDIYQDFFSSFYKHDCLNKFTGDTEARFLAYITRICLNHVNSHFRRRYDSSPTLSLEYYTENVRELSSEWDLENEFNQTETAQQLEEAVRTLRLAEQEVVRLRLMDYTHKEIGAILGIPKGTVDARMAAAKDKLRPVLAKKLT